MSVKQKRGVSDLAAGTQFYALTDHTVTQRLGMRNDSDDRRHQLILEPLPPRLSISRKRILFMQPHLLKHVFTSSARPHSPFLARDIYPLSTFDIADDVRRGDLVWIPFRVPV